MQGVILSAGSAQGLILGDDGVRYTFTPLGWQDSSAAPVAGMRVEFEARGAQAVGIVPIPGAAPAAAPRPPAPQQFGFPSAAPGIPPTQPVPVPPAMSGIPPAQPPSQPPARRGFGSRWWRWALAGGGALAVVLVIAGGFVLGFFGISSPPVGREMARHTHEGRTYVLVEYGNELAIFSDSGAPVAQPGLAEDILRSYAWRQLIEDFDVEGMMAVSQRVQRVDDAVSDARSLSNSVVSIFDALDNLEARVPILGTRISAMDVVRGYFQGVSEAEGVIRSLDQELNDLGRNTESLAEASARISSVELSSVSGEEMEALFAETAEAAQGLASSAGSANESVSEARTAVGDLAEALWSGSDTPVIGGTLEDFARRADSFESELAGLSGVLASLEADLGALAQNLEGAMASADSALQADMDRWLPEPYDPQWPPTDPERQPEGATPPPPTVEAGQTSEPATVTPATAEPEKDAMAMPGPTPPPVTVIVDTGQQTEEGETVETSRDRAALVALYNATEGPDWDNDDNWLSDKPVGEWHGVTTGDSGRVVELRLVDNRLNGPIPPELADLSNLRVLDLSWNKFAGQPINLERVPPLYEENGLSVAIPPELGNIPNLRKLNLSVNILTGWIPAELGNLSHLKELNMYHNHLNGDLPAELGNLVNLELLDLGAHFAGFEIGSNSLTGEIPAELGTLTSLKYLDLSDNNLTGEIPSEMVRLAQGGRLYIVRSPLSGCIPAEVRDMETYDEANDNDGNHPDLSPRFCDETVPFELDFETSSSEIAVGNSFILSVQMHNLQERGEHGGISVSFPSLTEPGGSARGHSSGSADVDVLDYTSGLLQAPLFTMSNAISPAFDTRLCLTELDALRPRSDPHT